MRLVPQPRVFLLEAITLCYAFTAAALRPERPSFLEDPAALFRLAIPAAAAISALLLRNAFATEERPPYAAMLDVALALGMAILTQAVFSRVRPELALPRWTATEGCLVSFWFLTGLRAFFPPRAGATDPGEDPLPLRWKAEEFEREIVARRPFAYLAAAVLLATSAVLSISAGPRSRAGYAILIAGALYLLVQFATRGAPHPVPAEAGPTTCGDFYRDELRRQLSLLRRVWCWYGFSLVPALALLLPGSRIYLYFALLPVLLLAEVTLRYAERLQREIAAVTYATYRLDAR